MLKLGLEDFSWESKSGLMKLDEEGKPQGQKKIEMHLSSKASESSVFLVPLLTLVVLWQAGKN